MRILVVEDDPAMRDVLERGLRDELFHVDAVQDGVEAEQRGASQRFDAIVLDVALPAQDGFKVCAHLRARGIDTPILLLTACSAVEDRVRGLDAGADDYLAKPFAFPELLARLRALTRRGRTRHLDATLTYGPIALDRRDQVAKVNGRVVILTATEFRLLEFMLQRAETIVTRDDLSQHVWGTTVGPDSNVIDVYIGYVRKKLEPAGIPLLRTVRRLGYTLKKGRL